MAYSLMADLPPINGLYVSFFTVVAYFFLGTSRHLSLGIYGVVSLMVRTSLDKYEGKLFASVKSQEEAHDRAIRADPRLGAYPFYNYRDYSILSDYPHSKSYHYMRDIHRLDSDDDDSKHFISNDPVEAKIMIASALSLLVAAIQIVLAIFHAGVVTKYLSDVIISAFTVAAAYHIVASQFSSLLGIAIGHENLPFKIAENIYEIAIRIKTINWATVIISLVSMVVLFLVKHFINHKYQEKLIAPFPIELVIVSAFLCQLVSK